MRCTYAIILGLMLCLPHGEFLLAAQSTPFPGAAGAESGKTETQNPSSGSLYVKVELSEAVKVSALKPGDVVEGKLSRDVYSGERDLFPEGARVRLIVDKLGRRRRVPNDHWPWVIKFFTPRHENYPTFRSASVFLGDGKEVPLQVSLVSIRNEVRVHAQVQGKPKAPKETAQPTVTLEASLTSREAVAAAPENESARPSPERLAAGTTARVILLSGVSAGKSRPGDSFQARLVEPVRVDSKVLLPEGTLLEGKVVKSMPPRMLSRAGSLLLGFTNLTLPGAAEIPASASVTSAALDQRSHTLIDPEGRLRGDRPGKLWMLVNVGVTAGIAKVVDDGTQLVIEAIVETATDVSTAGSARIAAICVSGIFMLTRHGRDVALPRFTEMNIVFDRPVPLGGAPTVPQAP